MDSVQNSAIDEEEIAPSKIEKKPKKHKKASSNTYRTKEPFRASLANQEEILNKYSKEANEGSSHSRQKRGTRRDENRNTCSLYIQTDPLIWKHIREGFPEVS